MIAAIKDKNYRKAYACVQTGARRLLLLRTSACIHGPLACKMILDSYEIYCQ